MREMFARSCFGESQSRDEHVWPEAGSRQTCQTESCLCTRATLPHIRLASPFPASFLVAAAPRSSEEETEEADLEKVSAVGKQAAAVLHKEALDFIDCIWLCFAHTRSWTPDSSEAPKLYLGKQFCNIHVWQNVYQSTSACQNLAFILVAFESYEVSPEFTIEAEKWGTTRYVLPTPAQQRAALLSTQRPLTQSMWEEIVIKADVSLREKDPNCPKKTIRTCQAALTHGVFPGLQQHETGFTSTPNPAALLQFPRIFPQAWRSLYSAV
ncbi:hypothetical protein P7K49_007296 [Saguinus oedipus]|uniref:Uncharacterized protein n=1 Tax=Saguinus oedipus TaxID=9490 RepID=A0ABQ9VUI3_SAGOE|nr:hypothetical protein P7K49_007296 [Saguinus oedipus]